MNYPAYYCTALALCRLAHLIRSCRPFKSPNSLCSAKFKISCCLVFKNTCYFQCRRGKRPKWATAARRATQCDYKWLKNAENVFTWCDFPNFFKQRSAELYHFRFRSFHMLSYSKFAKPLQAQVSLSNFTFFSEHYFWRVFAIGPKCGPLAAGKVKGANNTG